MSETLTEWPESIELSPKASAEWPKTIEVGPQANTEWPKVAEKSLEAKADIAQAADVVDMYFASTDARSLSIDKFYQHMANLHEFDQGRAHKALDGLLQVDGYSLGDGWDIVKTRK